MKMLRRIWLILIVLIGMWCLTGCGQKDSSDSGVSERSEIADDATYSLLIKNGRVIDPETGRDEIATVAVKDGLIARISSDPGLAAATAEKEIDATGLVVSPGFIDTHQHESQARNIQHAKVLPTVSKRHVQDGITFWLGGNCGTSPTGLKAIGYYDGDISVGDADQPFSEFMDQAEKTPLYNNCGFLSGNMTLRYNAGVHYGENETAQEIEEQKAILEKDLQAGSFGISFGVMYDTGVTKEAMIALAQLSKDKGGMAASHIRFGTLNLSHLLLGLSPLIVPQDVLYEAIDTCKETRVPFIISHMDNIFLKDTSTWATSVINNAIKEGYPLAGDNIGTTSFQFDVQQLTLNWQIPIAVLLAMVNVRPDQIVMKRDLAINGKVYIKAYVPGTYADILWLQANHEKVDKDPNSTSQFGFAIIEDFVTEKDMKVLQTQPWAFISTDRVYKLDPATLEPLDADENFHETYLGNFVNDRKLLTLQQYLFKSTIGPALWLGLERKGRLRKGYDADITVFDPNPPRIPHESGLKIFDTYKGGIKHVIVGGQLVLENGEITGATPGKLIRRTWNIKGDTQALVKLYEQLFPEQSEPLPGYKLSWADEFDGDKLDTAKWDYRTDSKHWSTQKPENVSVADGRLKLAAKKENAGGKEYTGGGVISKMAFKYGYYEAKFKVPPGAGWHTSFWMMKHDGTGGTGTADTRQELDVCENDSVNPYLYYISTHRWKPEPHKSTTKYVITPNLSAGFHVWGCEFTPETVKYFFDGKLVQTVDATWFPHAEQNIWLTTIASSLGMTCAVDETKLPAAAEYDYVRFYEKN